MLLFAILIIFSLWHLSAKVRAEGSDGPYAGWAVEAYPEDSDAEIVAMIRRMFEVGANVIWIGHNNPGEVDATKVEPGLSYAVYKAYLDPADPRHIDAVAIVAAQHRMLAACQAVGIKAVLPVGYQIQMGEDWNELHPDDLRQDASGEPLNIYGGGVSASIYAPSYWRDIEDYYQWVDSEFVRPYIDVLLMLNLADEPIGGDYSNHADSAFQQRYGFGFDDVGDDPERQRPLGEFQSRYIVEYAIHSAEMWEILHPGLPVTMSFDGGQARKTHSLPDVEALFRDTPTNFVITFDAYPRDGLSNVALSDQNLIGLYLLARSLGLYSARYEKPVWVWAAANSWGLSQASPDPGSVSDAVSNGISLALLIRQGGGDLQGIAYWNYNVKEQGLYRDVHETTYDVETMFAKVSEGLSGLRRLSVSLLGNPEVLILSPPVWSHQEIGAKREATRLEVQPYRRLSILAKEGVNAAIVNSLDGWPLESVRAIVVLSPDAGYLVAEDMKSLTSYLQGGGKVVASPSIGAVLAPFTGSESVTDFGGLVQTQGTLYVAQKGVAVLFEDRRHEVLAGFWREVLGLDVPRPGYRVVTDRHVFYYNLGPDPVQTRLFLPFEVVGYRYDAQASKAERVEGSYISLTLGRREYLLLNRVQWSRLRIE